MKTLRLLAGAMLGLGGWFLAAAPAADLPSGVYRWQDLRVKAQPNGVRRDVFDAPTATLARLNCHITTLKPGASSGAPRLHEQEEVILVQDGQIVAEYDGRRAAAGPGSVIFFAAHAVTALHNVGVLPATYFVINYYPRPGG